MDGSTIYSTFFPVFCRPVFQILKRGSGSRTSWWPCHLTLTLALCSFPKDIFNIMRMRTACPQKALTLCLAFLTLNRSHSYSGLGPRTGLRRKMPAKLVMKEPSSTGSAASLAAAFMVTVRQANALILFHSGCMSRHIFL